MKQQAARGRTHKHAGAHKHANAHAHAKHHPAHHPAGKKAQGHKQTVKAKHPHHAKARQLSPGQVSCCSAEAVAASLRLTGRTVGADDVLALYWRTASGPDVGALVLATLRAAAEYGLAGIQPVWFGPAHDRDRDRVLILGLELPEGPHAVCAEPRGWWSWGDLYDFPDAVLEEAWVVTWP